MDTGASSHICSSLQDLASERRLWSNEVILKLGDGVSVAAKAMETTSIDLNDYVLLLNNVLYVPNAYKNIISISSITRKGYKFLFEIDVCTIYFDNEIVWVMYYMVFIILIMNPIINNI